MRLTILRSSEHKKTSAAAITRFLATTVSIGRMRWRAAISDCISRRPKDLCAKVWKSRSVTCLSPSAHARVTAGAQLCHAAPRPRDRSRDRGASLELPSVDSSARRTVTRYGAALTERLCSIRSVIVGTLRGVKGLVGNV